MEIIIPFVQSIVYALSVFVFMFLAKKIADKRVSYLYNADYEIEIRENIAVALRRAGLYLGIAIGMYAAINSNGTATNFVADLGLQVFDGVLIMIFLFSAMFINDKIILKNINNDQALKDNNISVGLVEFGAYIATGLIAYGSFAGTGPWYTSIVFFILGQAALIIMVRIYESFTEYKPIDEVKEANVPAGLMLGGILVAYGFILKASIMGPFTGWITDLTAFAVSSVSGIVLLLLLANKAIDQFFLPGSNIHKEIAEDQDLSPIIVVVAVKIAIALIISAVVL